MKRDGPVFVPRTPKLGARAVLLAALTGVSLAASPALSQSSLLTIDVIVPGGPDTAPRSFADLDSLIGSLRTSGYEAINPAYSPSGAAEILVNFRGVPVTVEYFGAGDETENPATVLFRIPSAGIVERFDLFESRADNEDELERFVRENIGGLGTEILRETVRTTPFDPVAGNPNSLTSKMVEADFIMGTTIGPEPSEIASANDGYDRSRASFGLNARFGIYSAEGSNAEVFELPLNYALPFDDPRYALVLSAPFTYVRVEDTDSFSGSLGVGIRLPLYDNWSLTPAIRGGVVGSLQLGSLAGVVGASVTSNYRFNYGNLNFALGNSVAYLQTVPLEYDGTTVDYDLQNVVLRNGIAVSGPLGVKLFGQNLTWEASAVNTLYFGTDLYAENVTDLAISFGTVDSVNGFTWDSMRIGLTYTFAADADYQGLRLNFGYRF
jgi:hypothetical protein